jgi:hypothetical protein
MTENPDHQDRDRDDRNGSSAEDHKIAIAIDSFKRSYETAQKQRGEDDGKSLKWTRRMAVASLIYTGLTGLIIIASIYSVHEAQKAVKIAGRQANISEDTEKRQLRAYVISNKTHAVTYGYKFANSIQLWTIFSIVENIGNTPTRNLEMRGMTEHGGKTQFQILDHYNWKDALKSAGRRGVIGPKSETIFLGFETAANDLAQIAEWDTRIGQHYRLEMAGIITYQDIFNERHITEFCFAVYLPRTDFEHYAIGQAIRSDAELCPKHNCADDECTE